MIPEESTAGAAPDRCRPGLGLPGGGEGIVAALADNGDSGGALVSAVDWVAGLLLGTAGTALAVLAVAALGFIMLSGRLPVRRGASVIVGCFIIFSAGGVATGLLAAATRSAERPHAAIAAPQPAYTPSVPKAEAYDPYAGAAVPDHSSGDILN